MMSSVCDELLLAVLKSRKYDLIQIDSMDRAILRSRSSSFVFYIDICCLGDKPGEFQAFAYSLKEFRYGSHCQNRGILRSP